MTSTKSSDSASEVAVVAGRVVALPKTEKEKNNEKKEEPQHELENIKYRAFSLAREGICACSTPTSRARREAFRSLKFDLVSAGATASKAAKHIYYLSTAHPSDHYPATPSSPSAPAASDSSARAGPKTQKKEKHPFTYNFGMKSKQVNKLLELTSVELVKAVKSLMIEHFARLPRPAVLAAADEASKRQEEVENTWFLDMKVIASPETLTGWTGELKATLWDEACGKPAGCAPFELYGSNALCVEGSATDKFFDVSAFISHVLCAMFTGCYLYLDSFSAPNDLVTGEQMFTFAPFKILMHDAKLAELVNLCLSQTFLSLGSTALATDIETKAPDFHEQAVCGPASESGKAVRAGKVLPVDSAFHRDWAGEGQSIVACSECRYIGVETKGPFPWKKLGKCSGCSVVFYCSVACQRKDWEAGHNTECKGKRRQPTIAIHTKSKKKKKAEAVVGSKRKASVSSLISSSSSSSSSSRRGSC